MRSYFPSLVARLATPALGIVFVAMTGCDFPRTCDTGIEWGITVQLRPVPPESDVGTPYGFVRDGSYMEDLRLGGVSRNDEGADVALLQAAAERPGVYAVGVRRAGFQPWDTAGIVVRDGACHVEGATLTVELLPVY